MTLTKHLFLFLRILQRSPYKTSCIGQTTTCSTLTVHSNDGLKPNRQSNYENVLRRRLHLHIHRIVNATVEQLGQHHYQSQLTFGGAGG